MPPQHVLGLLGALAPHAAHHGAVLVGAGQPFPLFALHPVLDGRKHLDGARALNLHLRALALAIHRLERREAVLGADAGVCVFRVCRRVCAAGTTSPRGVEAAGVCAGLRGVEFGVRAVDPIVAPPEAGAGTQDKPVGPGVVGEDVATVRFAPVEDAGGGGAVGVVEIAVVRKGGPEDGPHGVEGGGVRGGEALLDEVALQRRGEVLAALDEGALFALGAFLRPSPGAERARCFAICAEDAVVFDGEAGSGDGGARDEGAARGR